MRLRLFDIHTHVVPYSEASGYARSVTAEELVAAMDEWGVAQAAVLPLESPECDYEYAPTAQTWEVCERHPERLVAFVGADPRQQKVLDKIRRYHGLGARGYGEHKCGLAIDDPRSLAVYELCGELGLPVLFHMDPGINEDGPGLPGLERVLRRARRTTFIAHGPGWWSAISADDDRRGGYPQGPVKPTGAADRLLSEFPNLYADISAGSGNNALTRDPGFTEGFLARHWRRLLFGTDYFVVGDRPPQPEWMRAHPMPEEWRAAIGGGTARRLLGLDRATQAAAR
jgi:predicted TIM-barrel fold metal-dependent hydrolase